MGKHQDVTMTILEHLAELRRRLFVSGIAFLGAAVLCFARVELIRSVITGPLGKMPFVFLSPPEALTANLRLSFIAGAVLALPVFLYQGLAFLFPAFYRREKMFFLAVLSGAFVLFSLGTCFAYRVVLPFSLRFFLGFSTAELEPYFNISDYISFAVFLILACGLTFQLPLITWAFGRAGFLSSAFLRRHRKIALLGILILAAVITPPDVVSQLIMAGPLLLLYELGVILVRLAERQRRKKLEAAGWQ